MTTLERGSSGETTPLLSIIIPAYNEEKRLPASLHSLRAFLSDWPGDAEVIVVDNGSTDATAALVRRIAADWSQVRLLQIASRGKGIAVREGLLAARGEYSFFCDADFSMPIAEITKFLPPQVAKVEIAIGTREGPSSHRFGEPLSRHLMGRAFNLLVRRLVLPGIQDSQCGFKCLRADIGRRLALVQTIHGWGFDVELLVAARRQGYRIVEIPIDWHYAQSSRIHPFRDAVRMTLDLLVVRRNLFRGQYDHSDQSSRKSLEVPGITGDAAGATSLSQVPQPGRARH